MRVSGFRGSGGWVAGLCVSGFGVGGCGLLLGSGFRVFGLRVCRFGGFVAHCRGFGVWGFGVAGFWVQRFRVSGLRASVAGFRGSLSQFRGLRFRGCGLLGSGNEHDVIGQLKHKAGNPGKSFHSEYASGCQPANLFSTITSPGGHFIGSAVAPHAPLVAIP